MNVTAPASAHVVDAIECILTKYPAQVGNRTIFDVEMCQQDDKEIKFQERVADLDSEATPFELTFQEGTERITARSGDKPRSSKSAVSKLDRELEQILRAAAKAGIHIDEVCKNYTGDDSLFQKSETRGSAEGARGELIACIKSNFRDSSKDPNKRDMTKRPIDIQKT